MSFDRWWYYYCLWWVNFGWLQGAHQACLSPSSSAGRGEKMVKNLVHWDKGSLIKKSNGRVQKQSKTRGALFSVSHQQVISSHSLGSRALVCIGVSLEDKFLNNECPLLSFYCWTQSHIGWNILLVILSELPQLCPLPSSPPPPVKQPLVGKEGLERQPWCCVSPSQQQPKHGCVGSTLLTLCTEHSTVRAAARKGNTIPAWHKALARVSTHHQQLPQACVTLPRLCDVPQCRRDWE